MKISLNFIIIFFLSLLILVGFLHPITAFTQDLGRHIETGEIILETKNVPKTNLYSYTYPDYPFINHHWFSEVVFYSITAATTLVGLQIVTTSVVMLSFLILLLAVRKKAYPLALGTTGLLYVRLLFERSDIRPEMFSFLFLSLFVTILYRNREKFTRLIFVLPFLELLWINMHIYFFVGIILIALFLFTVILNLFQDLKIPKQVRNDNVKRLLLVFFLACVATLFNPNGIQGALYPLQVFNNYGYTIEENQQMFFLLSLGLRQGLYLTLAIISTLFFICLIFDRKKAALIDWLLFGVFLLASVLAVRNTPLFLFTTFIPFSIHFSALCKSLVTKLTKKYPLALPLLYGLLFLCFLWQGITIISAKGFGVGVATGAERAVNFFVRNHLKGPIFNNFDIGSYLDYRLYPKTKVFIDGRPEAYPASFLQQTYIPMQENPTLFEKTGEKYQFNTIFFSHTDQTPWAEKFLQTIIKNKQWTPVYLDDTVVIFVKNIPQNRNAIKRFALSDQSFHLSLSSQTDFSSLLQLTRFFNLVGWQNQEAAMYQKLLDRDPNYCLALHNLAVLYAQQNNPSSQIYAGRFEQTCQ